MQHSVATQAMDMLAGEISTALPSLMLRISNAVAYVVLIAINVASSLGALGPTNAELSRRHPTPLTPAGWAFSIWGLIFALQGLGIVYQLMPQGYTPDGWKQRIVNSVGYGWQIGFYFEVAWQCFFAMDTVASLWVCAFLLLGAFLGFAVTLLSLYRLKDTCGSLSSVLLYAAYFLPTTLNTAWLSVAAGVGALILPQVYGWESRHAEALAIFLIALVTTLGGAAMQRERDTAYGLTLVWALVAVYGQQQSRAVRIAALVCVALNMLLAIVSLLRRKRYAGDVAYREQALQQPFKSKADEDRARPKEQYV